MTYDREDATRLAYNVYRKHLYDQQRERKQRRTVAAHVPTLEALLRSGSGRSGETFISKSPDVQYLGGRSGLPPAFIRRMVGWFGEPVVLEAMRCLIEQDEQGREGLFVAICRRVEGERA